MAATSLSRDGRVANKMLVRALHRSARSSGICRTRCAWPPVRSWRSFPRCRDFCRPVPARRGSGIPRRSAGPPCPRPCCPVKKIISKLLAQQGLILGPAAGHDADVFRREASSSQQLLQRRGGGGGGVGAGLDHGRVLPAARASISGSSVSRDRVILRAHDEHRAVGGRRTETARRKLGQRRGHPAVPHQAAQGGAAIQPASDSVSPVSAHIAFGLGLAQVGPQGAGQFGFVPLQRVFQSGSAPPPPRFRRAACARRRNTHAACFRMDWISFSVMDFYLLDSA